MNVTTLMNTGWYFGAVYLLATWPAHAGDVFSPHPANQNSIGGSPFLITTSEAPSMRVQYVHSAQDFIGTGPILINQVSYSTPTWSGRLPIDVTLPNIEIRISTTQMNPDALSRNFADNIGADETVVYSGSLHFYETEAELYDIHVAIGPFAYNPALGNLLIDIFNYSPIFSRPDPDWSVNAATWVGDSVSLLSSGSNGADAASGFSGSIAPMIRFTYTAVPEPGTLTILVIGLVSFGVAAFKRRRK